jgi:hypothetical protein
MTSDQEAIIAINHCRFLLPGISIYLSIRDDHLLGTPIQDDLLRTLKSSFVVGGTN